ncbi:MAG: proline/alanine-rich repetetive rane anchored protein [Myxococcaceae bacterium]|nr:proline/alanine-rich repetetive rane anchored protein [Myxococcaceae bacterium]
MSPTKATKKPTASGEDSSAVKSSQVSSNGSSTVMQSSSLPPAPASTVDEGEPKDPKKDRAPSAAQTLALELSASMDGQAVLRHAVALEDDREATANQAARLVQELSELKPELLVPLIERFSRLLISKNKRVVASCANALAPLSRIAPAKVAKQLPLLTQNWEHTTEEGKDGLVRTFAGLCTASVAYQKRLEPALARALGEAEPKLLIRWTEIVLPALKGEPHARARAVVEERLPAIPRPQAQKIADFLGIKLRPLMR